ncbi:MOSC-domain-containing protein [Dissoconium aciculare CBS 342.82]|uniref:MOSC-domain-containing protein n=1 Tax=Dissoconium aciculare CBS 342.82 TaxID=1314786 RepID=A0A6J3MCG1_9PEZI|nr:MOSC-domain-containing protein [Dissoconium aciculare CBS 342.82]KAF1825710.1 MOSC-domain-containing protein [Dissoconium aciculare CBS 342.82]
MALQQQLQEHLDTALGLFREYSEKAAVEGQKLIANAPQHFQDVSEKVNAESHKLWESIPLHHRSTIEQYAGQARPGSLKITLTGQIIFAALIGLLSLTIYLKWTPKQIHDPRKNLAAGGPASLPVEHEDAPPIPPPTEVVALYVYPIKSCRGFQVNSTRLRKSGLTLDRNWMFIDAKTRNFLTIRSDPNMTLINTSLVPDPKAAPNTPQSELLRISVHGSKEDTVTIPAYPTRPWLEKNTALGTATIWEEPTEVWDYPETINALFSKFFSKPVLLVYKGPSARPCSVNGRPELYGSSVPHHFADVMSLTIASAASIADLNKRLGRKGPDAFTIERFRPNIVVRGDPAAPWEEDTWKRIRISTVLRDVEALYKIDLDVVARCARCQVPNVDPDTADKHPKEPWGTLMGFRRVDEGGAAKYKPCFGMLCIPRNEGVVQVGAKLEVLETTGRHLYNVRAFADL